jgi:sugar lactone lactonase YvrE
MAIFLSAALMVVMLAAFDYEVAYAVDRTDPTNPSHAAPKTITVTTSAVGDPLARIQCGQPYSATIYAEGLAAPDGLAFGPDDLLYVAEETGGQVSRVGPGGTITPVITGLAKPEGIDFDETGNLYVVEDVTGGRVVKRATNGVTTTVVSGLEAPEGITWHDDGSPAGILYITESNLEHALSISSIVQSDYRTRVSSVSLAGVKTTLLNTTGLITPSGGLPPTSVEGLFWSYTGEVVVGPDGLLYFSNELSGQEINDTITANIPPFGLITVDFHAESTDSIYTLDPANPSTSLTSFAAGLSAPEGLEFSLSGGFPLYVAEEGDLGAPDGRVSLVDQNGNVSTLCTGFEDIEDVALDEAGRLYVSEDRTGLIILLTPNFSSSVYIPLVLRPSS